MSGAFAISVLLFSMSAALVGAGWIMTVRLTPESARSQRRRWLRDWSIKGLLLPLALWAVMNVGLSWNLQPFMPQVQIAQNSGSGWLPAFFRVLLDGWFVLASSWTAVTLGWVLAEATAGLEDEKRASLKSLCWTCLVGMGLPALGLVWFGGWPVLGLAAAAILAPIAAYAPAILLQKKRPPIYSRAVARLNLG